MRLRSDAASPVPPKVPVRGAAALGGALRCLAAASGFTIALTLASAATAQPYGPGPAGDLPGTSMADLPIVGAPQRVPGIPGARIFGDTNEERLYGKPFDDSYLTPKVIRPDVGNSASRQAIEGRSALGGVAADLYAREGPAAIGGSAITRGQSQGRVLRRAAPPAPAGSAPRHPALGGRAIIRP
ncbi:hypothetical protein DYI37_07385 [Fulvimarina endophytica]|uniref:Uncharacterized protein n=1 Tax=Fulvimarina endophytica TaxID=2293836 RepID=A0A371X4L5_9HYPH|nr:hypothetical protein [Fulvimarina endophytica]RFC64171.1 hypothetical protein DYI37_07385 [Fulvimarina endophytica]